MSVREDLAELEHEQWMYWSKSVGSEVSEERLERWRTMWRPYDQLTEEQKDQDRIWAEKVLNLPGLYEAEEDQSTPKLVSLTGEATLQEKAAFAQGVIETKEQYAKADWIKVVPKP